MIWKGCFLVRKRLSINPIDTNRNSKTKKFRSTTNGGKKSYKKYKKNKRRNTKKGGKKSFNKKITLRKKQ